MMRQCLYVREPVYNLFNKAYSCCHAIVHERMYPDNTNTVEYHRNKCYGNVIIKERINTSLIV